MHKDVEGQFKLKVLLVEDEQFTVTMVADVLARQGLEVLGVSSVSAALMAVTEFEPHVIVTDLDLGPGPDGSDLLNHVSRHFPWIGMVVLTAHSSPTLALGSGQSLPEETTFLIKSMSTADDIYEAIVAAVRNTDEPRNMAQEDAEGDFDDSTNFISRQQGELLRMMADGMSNAAIARERDRSLPATESMIHRLFASLGLGAEPDINPRVVAVRMWQQGKVRVK
jgi:DNA-binding NarL/FixJ family response regulator